MPTIVPLDGEQIAELLGISGKRRSNGDFELEMYSADLDVRVVLAISEDLRALRLFLDRGRQRSASYVGSINVRNISAVLFNADSRQLTFHSQGCQMELSIWPSGRFKMA